MGLKKHVLGYEPRQDLCRGKSIKGVTEAGDKTGMQMLSCSIYVRFPQVDNSTTVKRTS